MRLPPEFLDTVKCDDLLEQVCPVLLGAGCAGSLGKPERPGIHEGMLDVEILGVVEDSQGFVRGQLTRRVFKRVESGGLHSFVQSGGRDDFCHCCAVMMGINRLGMGDGDEGRDPKRKFERLKRQSRQINQMDKIEMSAERQIQHHKDPNLEIRVIIPAPVTEPRGRARNPTKHGPH